MRGVLTALPGGTRPRLIHLSTRGYANTVAQFSRNMAAGSGQRLERWSYDRLFAARRVPAVSYIFTDFDRMSPAAHELAARIYLRLKDAGARVFNDPRRFLPRGTLMRRMYAAGLNGFTCWFPALGEVPDRFPVFLRTSAGHRGVIGGLIEDAGRLKAALADATSRGHVLRDLIVVEYVDVSLPETGAFVKHAAFLVGDTLMRANSVTQSHWMAKTGELGAATPQFYRQERAELDDYPHADHMRRAFALSGMTFGRIDFGLRDGRPEIFEINTNPSMRFSPKHPDPFRVDTMIELERRLVAAMTGLATAPAGSAIRLAGLTRAGKVGRLPARQKPCTRGPAQ